MKLAIYQPYFFPYIGYFQLMQAVDKFILYDQIQFIKKGWIQRNRIALAGSKDFYVIIPIHKKSPKKLISELAISYDTGWQEKIIRQLQSTYIKSPFFNELFPFFENLLLQKYQLLTEFNCNSLIAIARLLDIKTMIVNRSDDYLFVEEELKKQDWPYDTKSQRIILICQYEKAHTYVNAIGGRQLYSKEVFKEQNIDLLFIQSEKYISDEHDILMPELSIIDVLFNYGVEKTKQLLNRFTLIK